MHAAVYQMTGDSPSLRRAARYKRRCVAPIIEEDTATPMQSEFMRTQTAANIVPTYFRFVQQLDKVCQVTKYAR